jgi:Mg-chelatase subunit ChlD
MKKDYTDIRIVLDESGSMASIRNDTIGGVNTFIKSQKEAPGVATFTLAKFNSTSSFAIIQNMVDIQEANELSTHTFIPNGGTPLLDAIGTCVTSAGETYAGMKEEDRPEKVVIVIVTDGEENESRKYTKNQISEMIKHQTDTYQWSFVFLAANQDAIQSGTDMGFSAKMSMSYSANAAGVAGSYGALSANMTRMRSSTGATMAFDDEQRGASLVK